MSSGQGSSLAAEAFTYGFPIVFNIGQITRLINEGIGILAPAPLNTFSHAKTLAGPEDKFVTVNNDTVYSLAPVDLSGGPVRLDVPDVGDRYYVLQFVDAWTNNFAYVGKRATGTGAGSFLLMPPAWQGEVPEGLTGIRFPTDVAVIVGRFTCEGVSDLPAVSDLQQQLALTALDGNRPPNGIPTPDAGTDGPPAFFAQFTEWMSAFPPSDSDVEYQGRFDSLEQLSDAELNEGLSQGKAWLEDAIESGTGQKVNGWAPNFHMFDYNNDFFEVGAKDDPGWKIDDRQTRHQARAISARAGLWGNHAYEAAYPLTFVDGDGDQLNGSSRYRLNFESTPPVDAFWSITMYDMPEFFLVKNPIDRYSLGDRTPGIIYGEDGSLSIVIQHEEPVDETDRANWLPAPQGDFRPVLRLYVPREEVLAGTWELPAIEKV